MYETEDLWMLQERNSDLPEVMKLSKTENLNLLHNEFSFC